jgi:hypothetical protein
MQCAAKRTRCSRCPVVQTLSDRPQSLPTSTLVLDAANHRLRYEGRPSEPHPTCL